LALVDNGGATSSARILLADTFRRKNIAPSKRHASTIGS
jgi:hypothetical protein